MIRNFKFNQPDQNRLFEYILVLRPISFATSSRAMDVMNSDGFDNSIPDRWNVLRQRTLTLLLSWTKRPITFPTLLPYFLGA